MEEAIEDFLYLLYQEDTLPTRVVIKVSTIQAAVKQITELRAAFAEARKVIAPFANEAKEYHRLTKNDYHPIIFESYEDYGDATYTVGDLRAAAEWLAKYPEA